MKSTNGDDHIQYALISTSDKTGLTEIAQCFVDLNIQIIATDGTASYLTEHNIPSTPISEYTGFPELCNGRVKTLHPKIHAGILARREQDCAELNQHGIYPIDFVIANLYPFEKITAHLNCEPATAIEHIDIGGVTLTRAAAKNYQEVTVIIDPLDYPMIMQDMYANAGTISLASRQQLASKAFIRTAQYDLAISKYFQQLNMSSGIPIPSLPDHINLAYNKLTNLRYGENPQQQAACFSDIPTPPGSLIDAEIIQGKSLSYNNYLDTDAALGCVRSLDSSQPACVIVKHATPCGAAYGSDLMVAYQQAYLTDPQSCFGGIIALNQTANQELAQTIINQQFVEVMIAPSFTPQALTILQQKKNLRVLQYQQSQQSSPERLEIRSISGGVLIQQPDKIQHEEQHCVTIRQPSAAQLADLQFAWRIVLYNKSNAIVYAKDQHTLGIGTGQSSRVFSAKIAALKAEEAQLSLIDAVMASDAFFPFADSIELAAQLGITAIIQPGGSKRDQEVIDAANHHNISMIFTGVRHFRH